MDLKKILIVVLKVFTGLIAIYLMFTWSRWWFEDDVMMNRMGISTDTLLGLSQFKSDMGGYVLTIGILTLLALWKRGTWYSAALIAIGAILGTRILAAFQDGFDAAVNFAIGLETVSFLAMVALSRLDRTEKDSLNEK